MNPFSELSLVLQTHIALALCAILLTIAISTFRRGTSLHKVLGRIWVAAMAVVALTSFFIHELRLIGPFSPIHLLSVYVLWNLIQSIRAVRRGDIAQHQRTMKSMTFWGLIVAGALTLFPGRTLHNMILGG